MRWIGFSKGFSQLALFGNPYSFHVSYAGGKPILSLAWFLYIWPRVFARRKMRSTYRRSLYDAHVIALSMAFPLIPTVK